jgi:hypothetical protein
VIYDLIISSEWVPFESRRKPQSSSAILAKEYPDCAFK